MIFLAQETSNNAMDLCDNALQQCTTMSPRRLRRQPSMESDVADNFLLQVKTFENNYGKSDEKENVSPNLHRPAVPAPIF